MSGEVFKIGEQVDIDRFYLDLAYQEEVYKIIAEAGVPQAAIDEFERRLNLAIQGKPTGPADEHTSAQISLVTNALYPKVKT